MKTAIKSIALAIVITSTMAVSNAQAQKKLYIAGPVPGQGSRVAQPALVPDRGCRLARPVPVLGIYGYATNRGMVITDVVRNSEAWDIGLERGDVIVEIDGRCIHDERDYEDAMRRTGRHTTLLVRDARGRGLFTLHAHLGQQGRPRSIR